MNYPINELAIIAPILFIVLLVAFPVIGLFAGWKRALYWGGGNLLFYIIGLLIWTFAGGSIVSLMNPLLTQLASLFKGGGLTTESMAPLVKSLAAPVFFLIVLLLGNILLVINYYAWYKRVVGLKKPKIQKEHEKDAKKAKRLVKKEATISKQVKVKLGNKRWFNMVVGSISLEVLMLPTTITLTQAALYATTSTTTRKNNGFANGLYNGLQSLSSKISWFSYYSGTKTGDDFNALFSTLNLIQGNTQYYIYDANGDKVYQQGSPLTAFVNVVNSGMNNIATKTKDANAETLKSLEAAQPLINSINQFGESWNYIMEQVGDDVTNLFKSENVTSLLSSMISGVTGEDEKITITKEQIAVMEAEDSVFNKMVDGFVEGTIILDDEAHTTVPIENQVERVVTTKEAYDNLVDSLFNMYNTDTFNPENEEDKQYLDKLKEISATQISMIVTYE